MTGGVLDEFPVWFVRGWLFAFGLVVGSFLNVVIHRVPRGLSVVRPGSACPGCGRAIRWHENVPVVSWLLLRGRCAGCAAPISARYALVELLTACFVLVAHEVFGLTAALPIAVVFGGLVIALVFTDLEHMLLPDALTLPGTFVGLALSFVSPFAAPRDALLGVLTGLAVVESMNLAYKLLRGRDGFGAGDTKMMMMMGAFLGWRLNLFSLVAASVVGTVVAVPLLLIARRRAGGEPETEGASDEAADTPGDGGGTGRDGEGRRSALWDVVPGDLRELAVTLTVLAAAASFVLPHATPARTVAGLLVGIALMRLEDAVARRIGRRLSPVREAWPLVFALAGLPPSVPGAVLAAVAALGLGVAGRLGMPAAAGPAGLPRDEDTPGPASPRPPLSQAEVPFGVFLGLGALVAILAGPEIIAWYAATAGLGSPDGT